MKSFKEIRASEHIARKEGITNFEYAVWWLMRISMAVAFVVVFKQKFIDEGDFSIRIVQIGFNLLLTFVIPFLRMVLALVGDFYKKLTFRCQTWLNVTIFLASFFGQGLDFYHEITSWDKIIHFVTGGTVVLIGNELVTMTMRTKDRISPLTRTVSSMGLSYFAIVIWELIEFFFDYLWYESELQRYGPGDEEDCIDGLFTAIFGPSANNNVPNEDGEMLYQWPLFDTNMDMFYAFVACAIVGIGLFVYLNKKEKKAALREASEEKETVTA